MDLGALPTDNLYKFMAMAGLALIAFATYVYYLRRADLRQRVDRMRVSNAVLEADGKEIDSILTILKGFKSPSSEYVEEVRRMNRSNARRTAKLKAQLDIADRLVSELSSLGMVVLISWIIGGALAITGFLLWYYRVQQYLDAAIQQGKA